MICDPCARRDHEGCVSRASCPCAHVTAWPLSGAPQPPRDAVSAPDVVGLDTVAGTFVLQWRDEPLERAAFMYLGHLHISKGDTQTGEAMLGLARQAGGVADDDELVEHI